MCPVRLQQEEDAWGASDDEERLSCLRNAAQASARNRLDSTPRPPEQRPSKPLHGRRLMRAYGPPSLEAVCLGCLAEYMPELLEAGDAVLPHLPAPTKLSLLTVARSQGLLDGAALALLVDGEWLRLDVAGCSKLGDAALQPALPQLPSLQALDLSGCSATASTLRSLPAACPNLAVLRLG
ncbi:hypothetical protein WJX84_002125 [Apatococcus fuscideae]|uniref:Uncharacterized protein n=1 Tax=Apatococcus fuscideae TaxID=2026836 RepID=A0AAW1STJ0_9CHLO